MQNNNDKKHLSFSGYSVWRTCPFKYKLYYIDNKKSDIRNIYIDFGSAMHASLEAGIINRSVSMNEIFMLNYDKLVIEGSKKFPENYPASKEENEKWKQQGVNIISQIFAFLNTEMPGYKIIEQEMELFEPIEDTHNWFFKGFIDVVIEWQNKVYIIDYKSTTYGWNLKKRMDEMVHMQLLLYKYYWRKKTNMEHKDVKLAFMLLKRTPAKNNIELFKLSASEEKINNVAQKLTIAAQKIDTQMFIKNRLSCTNCEFFQTEDCP